MSGIVRAAILFRRPRAFLSLPEFYQRLPLHAESLSYLHYLEIFTPPSSGSYLATIAETELLIELSFLRRLYRRSWAKQLLAT